MPPRNMSAPSVCLCADVGNFTLISKHTERESVKSRIMGPMWTVSTEPSTPPLSMTKTELPSQLQECVGGRGTLIYSPSLLEIFIRLEGSGPEIFKDFFPTFPN